MKVELTVPTSLSDIPLNQYQKFIKAFEGKDELTDEYAGLKMLEILYTFLCTFLTPRGAGAVERKTESKQQQCVRSSSSYSIHTVLYTRFLLNTRMRSLMFTKPC